MLLHKAYRVLDYLLYLALENFNNYLYRTYCFSYLELKNPCQSKMSTNYPKELLNYLNDMHPSPSKSSKTIT